MASKHTTSFQRLYDVETTLCVYWVKNVNNFQIATVQPQRVAQQLLDFAYKLIRLTLRLSLDYEKSVYQICDKMNQITWNFDLQVLL